VEHLTPDERGAFEVESPVDDLIDLAEPSERMKTADRRHRKRRRASGS
jgi:hypothetical protein